ncbi:MAG: shikimate dehydrogenase [Hyphomicrobiales bacterium]
MPVAAAGAACSPVLTGLVGAPISHSASPAMHEAAAQGAGFALQYRLIEIAGASRETLDIVLAGLRQKGFAGVNVTFPYKEMIVDLIDALSPEARAIGAVNTVVNKGVALIGHNTDASGFATAFRAVFGKAAPGSVALIGAGGVGRAIAFALAELGADELRIVDRDHVKAQALAKALDGRVRSQTAAGPGEALAGATGLVNATPAGMLPDRSSPVPAELLHSGLWVADAVYWPLWTPLLLAARQRGAKLITGRELCIHQAHDSFKLFTDIEPDTKLMGAAFDAVMRRRAQDKG